MTKTKRQNVNNCTELHTNLPISLTFVECAYIFAVLITYFICEGNNDTMFKPLMFVLIISMSIYVSVVALYKELMIQNNKLKLTDYIKRLNTVDKLYTLYLVANMELKILLIIKFMTQTDKNTVTHLIVLSVTTILISLIRFFPVGAMIAVLQDNQTILEEKDEPLNKKREINLVKYTTCYMKYLVNSIKLKTRVILVELIVYTIMMLATDLNKIRITMIFSIVLLATYMFINKGYDSNNLDNRLGARINAIYCRKLEDRQKKYDKVDKEKEVQTSTGKIS